MSKEHHDSSSEDLSSDGFDFQILNPFYNVSKERAEETDFTSKCFDTFFVFLGVFDRDHMGTRRTIHVGILDYFGFFIVRGLLHLSVALGEKRSDDEEGSIWSALRIIGLGIVWLVMVPLAIPYFLLGGVLTIVSMPFVWIVDKIWPQSELAKSKRSSWSFFEKLYDASEWTFSKGKGIYDWLDSSDTEKTDTYSAKTKRNALNEDLSEQTRQNASKKSSIKAFALNPSTWMLGTLLFAGISFLIQGLNPAIFAEAATSLFILQAVFMSAAALLLVGAVLFLAYEAIRSQTKRAVQVKDTSNLLYGDEAYSSLAEQAPKEQNGVANYLSELLDWLFVKRPRLGIPIVIFGAVGVLTVLVLTVGFFTGGFGLSPDAFAFMAPVFDFMTSGFTAGIQGAGALPGLGALNSISIETLHIIGQALSTFILFAAAIFVPDTLRRMLQTGWPEEAVKCKPFDQIEEPSSKEIGFHVLETVDHAQNQYGSSPFSVANTIETEQQPAEFPCEVFAHKAYKRKEYEKDVGVLDVKIGDTFTVTGISDDRSPYACTYSMSNVPGKMIPASHVVRTDAKALYHVRANVKCSYGVSQHFTCEKGDQLDVLYDMSDGVIARNVNGKVGYICNDFVEKIQPNSLTN